MKGFRFRIGVRLWDLGIKLRLRWVMSLGDKIKRSAMEDFV